MLGKTGHNFGSGMTGGFAYVLDMDNSFIDRVNNELVNLQRITGEAMEAYRSHLHGVLREYVAETASEWGAAAAGKSRRLSAALLAGEAEGGQPGLAAVEHSGQPAITSSFRPRASRPERREARLRDRHAVCSLRLAAAVERF
ncbi:hypothetical protein SSTU70S_07083 [Stutzerimonas stutzeri]